MSGELPTGSPARPRFSSQAWAELTRISNLPTIITNVLVGVACMVGPGPFPWLTFAVACVCVGLLYCAGMVMNDLVDLGVDRTERPGRPLPSGRISPASAGAFVVFAFLAAPAGLMLLRPQAAAAAVVLAGLIAAYNWLHAKTGFSVLLMGMCRAMVYGVAMLAIADRPPVGMEYPIAALAGYVVLLSVLARREATWGPVDIRWPAWILPCIPLPIVLVLIASPTVTATGRWLGAIACALFLAWTLFGISRLYKLVPRVVQAILIWLAGICLLDSIWLALMPRSELAVVAWLCFCVTVWAHRRILGT